MPAPDLFCIQSENYETSTAILSFLLPAGRNASIRCYSLEKSLNRPACLLFSSINITLRRLFSTLITGSPFGLPDIDILSKTNTMRAPVLFLICLYSTFVHAGTIRTETRLKSRVENILPVANAGQDIVLTLPVNSCILSGTANDEDGSIALYNWVKISGPESGILAQPDSATTTVVGLTQGVYVFRFTVTDKKGLPLQTMCR
jgi:hypothetical protein